MKGLVRVFLTVAVLLAAPTTACCQMHVVMQDGYTLTVDGLAYPTGTIVDDGDSTGQYANGFYGNVLITANPGDTIIVSGSYDTENGYDYVYLYDGSPLGDMGTQLGGWSGMGRLSASSYTGTMTVVFSTDGSVSDNGFVLHYEVRPSHCASNIFSFSASYVGATVVMTGWTASDTTVQYLLHYGGVDTVVTGLSFAASGLVPNTAYTFTLTPLDDTGSGDCWRTLSVVTPSFAAGVSGLRPLCGMDTLTLVADSADGYVWSTGATTRTVSVSDTGWYWLAAFTNGGGSDTMRFRVSGIELDIETHLPSALCPGDSALITVGLAAGSSVQVRRGESTLSESARIFLPDGVYCEPNGCSYRSELVFSGFEGNAHISDVNDIRYVMLNIEHSYIGDIYINITCPNNQSADILRYGGSGSSDCNSSIASTSRGWQGGGSNISSSTYLGVPYDYEEGSAVCDSTATLNQPGTGWRYCWSNCTDAGFTYAAGDGLIYRSSNYNYSYYSVDSSDVAAGTHFYHPDNSFASLVGCPMNGTWYIEVIDGWNIDNGYIFGWELALNPDRLSRTEYVPTVAYADVQGDYISRRTDTAFVVTAPLNLASDTAVTYTVIITDSLGCMFDTTITLYFHASSSTFIYDTVDENDLPRTFNGRTFYAEASNVAFHYPNSSGCDSLVVYNLCVHHNTTAAFDTSVCSGQLPLQWYHRTFYAAGTQYDTLVSHLGTDSLLTLTLHVLPTVHVDIDDTICSNQSLTFEGTTYTAAGTFPHSFLSSQGCDSIRTLRLVVLATSHGDTLASSCHPYLWHGTTFSTTDTLTIAQYATNAVGCDSAVTLHFTLLSTSHGDTLATACDHFTWHGTTFSTTDTLTIAQYTTNAVGCDSAVTLHLTINHSTDTNIYAEACDSYDWFGTHYLVPPATVPVHTLVNAVGCDSTLRLMQLTIHYSQFVYDFDTVCHDDILGGYHWRDTLLGTTATGGQYLLARTDQYGCDSILSLTLTVYDSTSATVYDTIVQNQAATWQYNGLPLHTDTTVQLTLTNHWGCDSLVTYHLHVWPNVYNTIDTTLCADQLATFAWHGLSAADTLVATLAGNHGVDSIVTLYMHVNPTYHLTRYDTICDNNTLTFAGRTLTAPGDYSHTFLSALGCDSLVDLHLTVRPTYSFDFYDTIYVGDTIFFEGDGYVQPGNYPVLRHTVYGCDSLLTLHLVGRNLHTAARTDSVCEGDTFYFCGNPLTEAGVYIDTVYSGDFFAGDTIVQLTLVVMPMPQAYIKRTFVCDPPAHYILTGTTNVSYMQWQGPTAVEGHEFDSIIAVPNPADTSFITLYVDYRPTPLCPLTIDMELPPIPTVNAHIDVRPTALTLDERRLTARNASDGMVTGQEWHVFYNEDLSYTDTVYQLRLDVPVYVDSVTIALKAMNEMCSSRDTVLVNVLRADILFPNVFTPSLESNSFFHAYTTAVSDFELWIYDRRGALVFHTTDINQGWDGTHDGIPLPQAAYVYKCRYRDQLTPNGYQNLTGTVTLLR